MIEAKIVPSKILDLTKAEKASASRSTTFRAGLKKVFSPSRASERP